MSDTSAVRRVRSITDPLRSLKKGLNPYESVDAYSAEADDYNQRICRSLVSRAPA